MRRVQAKGDELIAKHRVLSSLHRDALWAYIELRSDPTFSSQTAATSQLYLQESLKLGYEWALAVAPHSLDGLARRFDLTVTCDHSNPRIRSAYGQGVIYVNCAALSHLTSQTHAIRLSIYTLRRIAIAHELFHHLETLWGQVDELLPPTQQRGISGRLSRRVPVRACREIAAHRFAKELCGVSLFPSALDWLQAVGDGRKTWREVASLLTSAQHYRLTSNVS